jgi:acyl-lipid omega-6 desaturase (Delta-12 desaturase)
MRRRKTTEIEMPEERDVKLPVLETNRWIPVLSRYREPRASRSILELLVTAFPLVTLWASAWAALGIGYWLCLLLALPTAGFLIRLFMIQHDCGHGAFFKRRATNDWIGRTIGVVTLTPYGMWRRTHATHHATVGNLEHRGGGDIITLTVNEYLGLNFGRRLGYRLYRNPFVMFGIMPSYLFLVHHRLPFGLMRAGWEPWLSAMGTNVATAVVVMTMIWLVGIGPFLLVQGPVVLIAASFAMWLFYIQHQFEDTRWTRDGDWNIHDAALHGSSYYELPPVLAWFTGDIGVHHVHHLCSRIPFYRLGQILREHPELADVGGRLSFVQSLRCATLALWDEEQARLISFQELRRRSIAGRPLSGAARPTG